MSASLSKFAIAWSRFLSDDEPTLVLVCHFLRSRMAWQVSGGSRRPHASLSPRPMTVDKPLSAVENDDGDPPARLRLSLCSFENARHSHPRLIPCSLRTMPHPLQVTSPWSVSSTSLMLPHSGHPSFFLALPAPAATSLPPAENNLLPLIEAPFSARYLRSDRACGDSPVRVVSRLPVRAFF